MFSIFSFQQNKQYPNTSYICMQTLIQQLSYLTRAAFVARAVILVNYNRILDIHHNGMLE